MSERLEIYRLASLARRFEARVEQLAKAGELPATLHMGAGQEVAQVAAIAALHADDPMLYGHRGSAYWIARGVPLEVILGDIAYREGGSNRGKGGPMHVVDIARGVLGETGSLGGNLVIGTGVAYAEKYQGTGRVCIVFFGDGTANRGQFHEACNYAAVAKLPVLFFCENNGFGLSNPASVSSAVVDLAARAAGYAMAGVVVDGGDADAVHDVVTRAAARARAGDGPTLIEAKVVRIGAHFLGDREKYRSEADKAAARAADPLNRLRATLDAGDCDAADRASDERIAAALEVMRTRPLIAPATARERVFADE
jgi:acetoin:2,6-dichlorophenolindophenol oxidoreductase subunit alpha